MAKINMGMVRGTQIYTGDSITGTSVESTIFPNCGIPNAITGDLYINISEASESKGNIYVCTMSGDAGNSEWSYQGNIRGPEVNLINTLDSTSTLDALSAYQGKRLKDMMVEAGIFCKKCVVQCDEEAYRVVLEIDNIDGQLILVVDGKEYAYSHRKIGTSERVSHEIAIDASLGMEKIGGMLTEIRSTNAYIYSVNVLDDSMRSIYTDRMQLWNTVSEALQLHEVTGTITDGTEITKTGLTYKFLNGIKNLIYPITHAKAVWYDISKKITAYDKIQSNEEALGRKAPTDHASTDTAYGKGTGSNYGHVKLSDSITSSSAAAAGGTAATPKAVKEVHDLVKDTLPLKGGTMTGAVAFNAETAGNGMLYMINGETLLELLRAITGENPTLMINDGMYDAGIGSLNLSAGKAVRLLIKNERLILEESSEEAYSAYLRPQNDNKCTLGNASKRFYGLWAGNSTVQTSDAREKENVIPLGTNPIALLSLDETQTDIHSELFDRLKPVQFNFIDKERVCFGLIAQDVVNAMEELGIGENELDLVHHEFYKDDETKEEKESYGLAYNNLIALLIHEVQKLKAEIAALKE